MVAEQPIMQERLNQLANLSAQEITLLQRMIELKRSSLFDSKLLLRSKETLDQIRSSILEMQNFEKKLLEKRLEQQHQLADLSIFVILATALIFLTLDGLGGRWLRNSLFQPITALKDKIQHFGRMSHSTAIHFLPASISLDFIPKDELGDLTLEFYSMVNAHYLIEVEAEKSNMVLEAVIACSPYAIISIDFELKIQIWSKSAEILFGWPKEEVVGQSFNLILKNASGQREFLELINRSKRNEIISSQRVIISDRSGNPIPLWVSIAPIQVGATTGSVLHLYDIRQFEKNELERARLLAEEKKLRSLVENISYLSIYIADQALSHQGDLPFLLQIAADTARKLVSADYSALGIGTDPTMPFDPWVFSGMKSDVFEKMGRFPKATGILGWVARQGQSIRTESLKSHPAFGRLPEGHPPLSAFLGVSIRYAGQSVGNLYLANAPGNKAFSNEDQKAIELLAANLGVIIENSCLNKFLNKERKKLKILADFSASIAQTIDFNQISDLATREVIPDFGDCCIFEVIDLCSKKLKFKSNFRTLDEVTSSIIQEIESHPIELSSNHSVSKSLNKATLKILSSDTFNSSSDPANSGFKSTELLFKLLDQSKIISAIQAPIKIRETTLGIITIGSRSHHYTEEDEILAEEIARRAALAIDNSSLYQKAQSAVQMREDTLAIVSHDLRNPIATIKLGCEMIRRLTSETDEKNRKISTLVDRIEKSSSQMNRLIGDLLDAAAIDAGGLKIDKSAQEIKPILEESTQLFQAIAATRDIEIMTRVEDQLPRIVADRERVTQILSNLIGNAIKFCSSPGHILITANSTERNVIIQVNDTGPGIKKEDLPQLFDRYWQVRGTKKRGTGLGLYIAKGLVESQGGKIWAESKEGEGSTFSFTLPIEEVKSISLSLAS